MRRAVLGGGALALATGWNTTNVGAVAEPLADSYGVALATVGLFTTALFVTHLAAQIPGGRASDRLGARRAGFVALATIAVFNAAALAASDPSLALAARALTGFGTGVAFVAGSAYVRAAGGSPFAQGLFGGVGLAGGGLALAAVPTAEAWLGWRAPFATALAIAVAALVLLLLGPSDAPRNAARRDEALPRGLLRDQRLYRLAALHGASLGLGTVVGNWVVTLLDRHGGVSVEAAGVVGALTLLLGIVTRPLGGWILREHPERVRATLAASLVAGAVGTLAIAAAEPLAVAAVGAALVGIAVGIPFSAAFTGAAVTRPDAPAASVGFVNAAASGVVVAGAPLLGLAFALPGDGRLGFVVVAVLWAAALFALPRAAELGVARPAPGAAAG